MKKLIAVALLVGSFLTAFYGFALTAPMLSGKSMSRINDMTGNLRIELEIPVHAPGTGNRCVPFYVVAVLAGAAGIYVLSELREDDDEEDYF